MILQKVYTWRGRKLLIDWYISKQKPLASLKPWRNVDIVKDILF